MQKNFTIIHVSTSRIVIVFLVLFCTNFSYSEKTINNSAIHCKGEPPQLGVFSPNTVQVGSTDLTITITGNFFLDPMTVKFNGIVSTPATFIDFETATIVLSTAQLSIAGVYPITLTSDFGESSARNFTVSPNANCTMNTVIASTSWANPSSWSCGAVPLSTTNVTIPTGKTITLDAATTVNNLTIQNNGFLVLNNANITVSGTLTSAATTVLGGPITGGYIVTQGTGSLTQNVTAGTAKIFPIGTSTIRYDPFSITSNLTQTVKGSVAEYILSGGYNMPELVIRDVWDITPASQATVSTLKFTPDPAKTVLTDPNGDVIPLSNPGAIGHYKRNTGFNYDEYHASQVQGTWTITNYHDGYSPFQVGNAGAFNSIVLAVDLQAISAINKGAMNIVEWVTAEEKNNALFNIERSIDGKRFQSIGTVKGNGTTAVNYNYSFEDRDPSVGLNYYRLQTVETNGTTSYSKIVSVTQGSNGKIKVFPTLAQDKLTILAETNKPESFEILNLLSQTVVSGVFEGQKEIVVSHLTNGVYVLKIAGESFKFVKN